MRFLLLFFFLFSPLTATLTTQETDLTAQINAVRTQHGLSPLRLWKPLTHAALAHSQDMARKKVPFGHTGFEKRAATLNRHTPLASFAENVAYNRGYPNPLTIALQGWMKSPPHRDNILGPFTKTGIGIALSPDGRCYITQLFATPAP